jgi:phospholipid/cholesterol/gamma-HCH transport system substrate-binding protein
MSFAASGAFETSTQDKMLGAFVSIALLALLYFYLIRADLLDSEAQWMRFHTDMSSSFGINKGASVTFSGVAIGSVESVELTAQGRVKVWLKLQKKYHDFYLLGSQLELKAEIGLSQVLGGSDMIFTPAIDAQELLKDGSYINSVEPASIEQLLGDVSVEEVAQQLVGIVTNLNAIVATVKDNQQQIVTTMNNAGALTDSLLSSANQLPALIDRVNSATMKMDKVLSGVANGYPVMEQNLNDLLVSSHEVTQNLSGLLTDFKITAEVSPILLNNLTSNSIKVNLLLDKLNQHWLLGSDAQSVGAYGVSLPADTQR